VDIVVPVRNEERDLAPSVRRLVAYLRESFPFRAQITIADNGSTDATWVIADRLACELPEVRAVHMELPGAAGRCGPSGRKARPRSSPTWMSICRQT
jgi:glycosyltransferase involved in cell wall biosynthesis